MRDVIIAFRGRYVPNDVVSIFCVPIGINHCLLLYHSVHRCSCSPVFRADLVTCTGCNISRYCDRMCQKKGWYFHKKECRNMKRIAPKVLPDAARMLARIIFKLEKGGAREQCFYTPRQFRVFMDLMSRKYFEFRFV